MGLWDYVNDGLGVGSHGVRGNMDGVEFDMIMLMLMRMLRCDHTMVCHVTHYFVRQ